MGRVLAAIRYVLLIGLLCLNILPPLAQSSGILRAKREYPLATDHFRGRFTPENVLVIRVNETAQVFFSITPIVGARNTTIRIVLPADLLKMVDGSFQWRGDTKRDESVQLSFTIGATFQADCYIRAYVSSTQDKVIMRNSYWLQVTTEPKVSRYQLANQTFILVSSTNLTDTSFLSTGVASPPSPAPGYINVYGSFVYINEGGGYSPMRYVTVKLFDADLLNDHVLLRTSTTNANGYYSFFNVLNDDGWLENGLDIFVEVYAENDAAVTKHGITFGIYTAYTPKKDDVADGNHDFGTRYPTSYNEAWQAADAALTEYNWINGKVGWTRSRVEIDWPQWAICKAWPHSHGNSICYPTSWVMSHVVIYHEYAHCVMYTLYGNSFPLGPGPDPHNIWSESSGGFAIVEGWAEFMECAVDNNRYNLVGSYNGHGGDIEDNDWHNCVDQGDMDGTIVEGSVASIFWDILDASNEAHDQLNLDFGPIFNVLRYDRPADIDQFWTKWLIRYGYRRELNAIYYKYGIDKNNPPSCSISSPNGGGWYRGTITVTAVASDVDGDIVQVDFEYSLDGTNWYSIGSDTSPSAGWSVSWNAGSITDSSVWIRARAKDNLGVYSSWDSSDSSFGIDNAAPGTPLLGESHCGLSWTAHNSPYYTWGNPGDSGSGVSYYQGSINDGTPFTVPSPYHPTWSDGIHAFKVRAVDGAGNIGAWSNILTIKTDTTAPTGSISINSGATYTTSMSVTLTLSATDGSGSGVVYMCFSNDGSSWSSWYSYSTSMSWNLMSGDGTKTVYVQFKDNVGLLSSPYSDTIILDTTPPAGSISINGGAAYTRSTSVSLTLTYTDATSGVSQVRYSNDGVWDTEPWESPSGTKPWTLTVGDGAKTVYYQIGDNAGLTSTCSATIILDTLAPSAPTLLSPSNRAVINTLTPTFTWSASTDSTSGVASYTLQIDTSIDFTSTNLRTITGITSISHTPGSSLMDGTWHWRVKAVDNAGNEGSFSSYWSLTVDTTPPTGSILINGGATYTTSTSATLTLSASDANGVVQMRFSNDGSSWSAWEYFSTSKSWTLTSGDGTKTVYVKYKDNAGLESSSFSDTIVLDASPPSTVTLLSPSDKTSTFNTQPTFQWNPATDTGSGIASYTFQIDTSKAFNSGNLRIVTGITSTSYTPPTPLAYGTWYWRVKAIDNIGNEGSFSSYWILYVGTVTTITRFTTTSTTTAATTTTYSTTQVLTSQTLTTTTTGTIPGTSYQITSSTKYSGSVSTTYTSRTTLQLTSTSFSTTTTTLTSAEAYTSFTTQRSKTGTMTIITTHTSYGTSGITAYEDVVVQRRFIEQFLERITCTINRWIGALVKIFESLFVTETTRDTIVKVEPRSAEPGHCRFVFDASPKPGYVNKPVNISGVMYGSWRCIRDGMVVGKPVTITAGWGFSTIATTDYYGRFSVTTNCPSTGGTYPITATFLEDEDLTGASTTIQYEVVSKIPTVLTVQIISISQGYGVPPLFGVAGYLKTKDGGLPIAGKTIYVTVRTAMGETRTYECVTDANGYYRIPDMFTDRLRSASAEFKGDADYEPSTAYA